MRSAPSARRANTALARYRPWLEGRRLFLFPDSQLEIPIARFLHEECGMTLVEVGTPYLDRLLMDAELARLPEGVQLSEGQDVVGVEVGEGHVIGLRIVQGLLQGRGSGRPIDRDPGV